MSTFTVDRARPTHQQARCDTCHALMPNRWQDKAAHWTVCPNRDTARATS